MSDTVIFGKIVKSSTKAMLLYVTMTIALSIGQSMYDLKQEDWNTWWWMKRVGWVVILLGNVANTIKAFYSNSSPAKVA